MVLWIVLACLAALTLAFILRPLLSGGGTPIGGSDDVVYAAQLEEIEADRARGAIGEAEADAARTEVARRLLRAHRNAAPSAIAGSRRWVTAAVLALVVPGFAVGLYQLLGMPAYGDRPLATRALTAGTDIAVMIETAERRLAENPQDGAGWSALAPMYMRQRRFEDAAEAYAKAAQFAGESAPLLTGRGQALMFAADGEVTEEAEALFRRAAEIEPEAAGPQVFLAVAARQRGDIPAAAARWRPLLEGSDGTEPWLAIARAEIAAIQAADPAFAQSSRDQAVGGEAAATDRPGEADLPGPQSSPGAAAAIAALPADQRTAQVEGMVARLASRLEADGGSVAEWVRLVTSYRVLGQARAADEAIDQARASLDDEDRAAFDKAILDVPPSR